MLMFCLYKNPNQLLFNRLSSLMKQVNLFCAYSSISFFDKTGRLVIGLKLVARYLFPDSTKNENLSIFTCINLGDAMFFRTIFSSKIYMKIRPHFLSAFSSSYLLMRLILQLRYHLMNKKHVTSSLTVLLGNLTTK